MRVAFSRAHDIVLLLLELEAQIQRQDGLTALMYAVQGGRTFASGYLSPGCSA